MQAEIIDYIKRNRVSTTEIADCLNKSGVVRGVRPLTQGHFCVGPVLWAYAWDNSNWTVHEAIADAPEGHVILIDAFECGDRAPIGDIVAKYLLLYRQSAGIVMRGNVRDVPRLIKENWPIWAEGGNPVGCFNHKPDRIIAEEHLAKGEEYQGAIAVCDDCGVVIIKEIDQTAGFLAKLEAIEALEDQWYDCINRRKWSTFDTICLKKYLHE